MITRFAPSPTGPLHLGHAYSAILAHDMAKAAGGQFLLRIEDIDQTRARPEWEDLIYEDLTWLGVNWDGAVMRQSDRLADYTDVLDQLWQRDLLYLCHCNRRDIQAALSAPQEGVALHGPDGPIYPGTCRNLREVGPTDPRPGGALRLRSDAAQSLLAAQMPIEFVETGTRKSRVEITDFPNEFGDIVLSRRDFLGSYHLSVVLDDSAQNVTHVVRGEDLFDATKIHVVLQKLLGLPTPIYHHHRLIRDEAGKRLAKRDDARAIRQYRQDGYTPADIREMVGLIG